MVCFLLIIIESFKARSGSFVPVKRRFAFSFDVLLFFSFHFSLFTYLKVNDVGQRLFFFIFVSRGKNFHVIIYEQNKNNLRESIL